MISPARALILAAAVWGIGVGSALAQAPPDTTSTPAVEAQTPTDSAAAPPPESPAPPDTTTTQAPADTTAAPPPVTQPLPADTTTFAPRDSVEKFDEIDPPKRDRDRFELGLAKIKGGDYDFLGTFAYHRFVKKKPALEQWVHIELSGGKADQITEIAASVAYLFRPVKGIKRSWPVQPIFEFGPGFHLVNQIADIEGFGDNAFHTHAYFKAHAFAGFDLPLTAHLGLVTRGRLTVPSHHALDYAQIALFLR